MYAIKYSIKAICDRPKCLQGRQPAACNGGILKKIILIFVLPVFICLSSLAVLSPQVSTKEIADMYGSKVTIPGKITKVFSVSVSLTPLMYTLAPDLLAALNREVKSAKFFYSKEYLALPAIGGSSSSGTILNQEVLLNVKPDIIIAWGNDMGFDQKARDAIKSMGIPVVRINIDSMQNYPAAYTFLGKLLGREKRAAELAAYISDALARVGKAVASIPAGKRLTVYYAGTDDGLNTACVDSWHAELIPFAGGINPVRCVVGGHFTGIERINFEQVMLMDPDVILSIRKAFSETEIKKKKWLGIKAVKTGRIYTIPELPSNWSTGPPSFLGIMGLQWLAANLYPEYFKIDIEKETAKFMKLFYGIDFTPAEVKDILNCRNIAR